MGAQGRVVWHDLMTSDLAAAQEFYGELFGWQVQKMGEWSFWADASGQHFGTVMSLPPGQPMPPHWVPYFAVNDLDAALAALPGAGGKVHVPKTPAGETGHFSIVSDPQGAVLSLWQYSSADKSKPEVDGNPAAGSFCWDELHTSDPAAAEAFYVKVVGYGADHMEMPGMKYTVLTRDAKRPDGSPRQGAGMMQMMPGTPHPFWLSYVSVADCDASLAKATSLGGKELVPPTNIPNIGRFAILMDPSNAAIALLGPNK